MWVYEENVQSTISFPYELPSFFHYSYLTASLGDRQYLQHLTRSQLASSVCCPSNSSLSKSAKSNNSRAPPTCGFRVYGTRGTMRKLNWGQQINDHGSIFYLQCLVFPLGIVRFTFSSCLTLRRRAPSIWDSFFKLCAWKRSSHIIFTDFDM